MALRANTDDENSRGGHFHLSAPRGTPRPAAMKMGACVLSWVRVGAPVRSGSVWCCEPVSQCDRGRAEHQRVCPEHEDEILSCARPARRPAAEMSATEGTDGAAL